MSLAYMRKRYGVPVKRGGRVRFKFKGECRLGTIRGASNNNVRVEPDDYSFLRLHFHPTDLIYLE